MIVKKTYAYKEFNQGFGLISTEELNMSSSELIIFLLEKYGDTLWNSIHNVNGGMKINIPEFTSTNGTEYEYLILEE